MTARLVAVGRRFPPFANLAIAFTADPEWDPQPEPEPDYDLIRKQQIEDEIAWGEGL